MNYIKIKKKKSAGTSVLLRIAFDNFSVLLISLIRQPEPVLRR